MERQPSLEALVKKHFVEEGQLQCLGVQPPDNEEARQISSQNMDWDRSIAKPKESEVEKHEAASS